ncbi:MAG: hypothetical protein ACFFA5_07615 [Promethearchaeota archaeon]
MDQPRTVDELVECDQPCWLSRTTYEDRSHLICSVVVHTIALQEEEEAIKFTHEGIQHGSVSMRCFQIG